MRLVGLEPLADSWIEVVHDFPVEGVSRAVVEVTLAVRNSRGDLLAHPQGGEDVVFSADHETGSRDVPQLVGDIVIHTSCGLALKSVERLWNGIVVKVISSRHESLIGFVVVPEGLGKDQKLDPLEELTVVEVGLARLHVFEDGGGVAIAFGPWAHEDGALHLVGVPEAQLLGDDGAHGNPHDPGAFDSESIHETGVVVCHHLAGVVPFRLVGESDPAVVRHDAAKFAAPIFGVGFPDFTASGDSHDQDERITAPLLFIIHLNSVGFDVWHKKEWLFGARINHVSERCPEDSG